MRGPNIDVVFSPKKTFQDSNFTKLKHFSLNFSTYQDHNILDKSVSAIFQKNN